MQTLVEILKLLIAANEIQRYNLVLEYSPEALDMIVLNRFINIKQLVNVG